MPKGSGRPYSKPERQIAAGNKMLRDTTKNRTMNSMDGTPSNTKRGRVMGLDTLADDASSAARAWGSDYDIAAANDMRSKYAKK